MEELFVSFWRKQTLEMRQMFQLRQTRFIRKSSLLSKITFAQIKYHFFSTSRLSFIADRVSLTEFSFLGNFWSDIFCRSPLPPAPLSPNIWLRHVVTLLEKRKSLIRLVVIKNFVNMVFLRNRRRRRHFNRKKY